MKRSLCLLLLVFLVPAAFAQAKKKPVKKTVKKPAAVKAEPASASTTTAPAATAQPTPAKKNERTGETTGADPKKNNRPGDKTAPKPVYPFFYEFSQPAFDIDHLVIEHDDTGKGTVTFSNRDYDESYTDPIQLSAVTMEKLKGWWDALKFLDSTEDYQSVRQYAHLGTIKLRLRRDKRERTAELNWTENKDVKALMDEYRNLGFQFVWMFKIVLSRENQPLEAPTLVGALEGMLKRNEISDPQQMMPILKELSEDERIPMIARNHAARLFKQIEGKK
ncbi:MAG TPA: hypothetical protein VGO50_21095 [Pyrinomonadaceae bacterium]|jgi:hypothetical protein|nr:hypothetical protein [Pyrinomonadaceae bacterium]